MTKATNANTFQTTTAPLGVTRLWEGAFWKVLSCAAFALINGIVRYLSGGMNQTSLDVLPLETIIFFQNLFGTFFLLPFLTEFKIRDLKTAYPGLHFLRIATAVAGIYLWYLTLKVMPIAEGVALSFTGPIFTVIGASLLLHEKIDKTRFVAISLSLIGAFIISRPDIPLRGGVHPIGFSAIFPLSSAFVLAFSKLLTRKLARQGETPMALTLYLLLFMAPVSFIPACFHWSMPTLTQWPWLLLMGALATVAHLSFSKAYQLAEVTFLTPFGFTKFFLSMLVGFVAFSELPTSPSLWLGISVIFLSILALAYKSSLYSLANCVRSSLFKNNE